jgi:manganese/zinc/iron transport system substrate-binding protein
MMTTKGSRTGIYNQRVISAFLTAVAVLWTGCALQSGRQSRNATAAKVLEVVASVPILADLVQQVGGTNIHVINFVPEERAELPYLFAPNDEQRARILSSDAIFYVGAALDYQSLDLYKQAKGDGKKVVSLLDELDPSDLLDHENLRNVHDPHLWLNARLWAECATIVAKHLSELDPLHAEHFAQRGRDLNAEYSAVDRWARARSMEVSHTNRLIVTTLPCMRYFARSYGFRVHVLEVSTAPLRRATLRNKAIQDLGVNVVFDRQVHGPSSLEMMLAATPGVSIERGFLCYSLPPAEMGSTNQFVQFMRHNINTVINALNK